VIKTPAAGATNYPNLFKKAYWGTHTAWNPQIIANRNQFVKDYAIMDALDPPRYFKWGPNGYDPVPEMFFDHVEFYMDERGGLILVTSPMIYWSRLDDEYRASAALLGFEAINRLYTNKALTFIKRFESPAAFKAWYYETTPK
jgi:hypothetical protein